MGTNSAKPREQTERERGGHPEQREARPSEHAHRHHRYGLPEQPVAQRAAASDERRGDAVTLGRRHELEEAVVIKAGLGRDIEPGEQHEEKVRDGAHKCAERSADAAHHIAG
jgi:hypothetical protein